MNKIDHLTDTRSIEKIRTFVLKEFGRLDERHNFRVSNEDIPLTEIQLEQAVNLTSILPEYIDAIGRLVKLCLINDKSRRSDHIFRYIRGVLNLGHDFQHILETQEKKEVSRDLESEEQILNSNISANHPFTRLDLIVDPKSGDLMIAEIEESKLHGFGYATLCRILSEDRVGIGLAECISQISLSEPIGMLLSRNERFYEVEAKFFEKAVNKLGGNLVVIPEQEMTLCEEGIIKKTYGLNSIMVKKIMTLPEFRKSTEEQSRINKAISRLYVTGVIDVLSFNMPLLGEKATLALISNSHNDPDLEKLLLMCFDPDVLNVLRKHIPSTMIPFNKDNRKSLETDIINGKQVFIKEIDSSGARGIGRPGDIERQIELLRSKGVIVQDAIEPNYIKLPFCDLQTGAVGEDDFTTRVGVFGISGKLADIAMTASPSPVAHGGASSIQTGVKIIK